MASSSTLSCLRCKHTAASDVFKNGWRLRNGDFAKLCPPCGSVYEEGKFCATFHLNDVGWRKCESCEKSVHCGCIVSFNTYLLSDDGGIICMECSRRNFAMARTQCLPPDAPIEILKVQQALSWKIQIEPQHWPRVIDSELQQIKLRPNSTVTPLFQKLLSASDVDHKLARLVIPQRCAEAFFPAFNDPNGCHITVLDTDIREWKLFYHCSRNGGSNMHILEGLRQFMILKKLQAGDTVTFYRVNPGAKLMMGLRKGSAGSAL